jgi:hypothetical protein
MTVEISLARLSYVIRERLDQIIAHADLFGWTSHNHSKGDKLTASKSSWLALVS